MWVLGPEPALFTLFKIRIFSYSQQHRLTKVPFNEINQNLYIYMYHLISSTGRNLLKFAFTNRK